MSDNELQEGMEDEGMSRSWTNRYIALLAFVRAQRDAAIAAAEGNRDVVAPPAPEYVDDFDLEQGDRLLAVLGRRLEES